MIKSLFSVTFLDLWPNIMLIDTHSMLNIGYEILVSHLISGNIKIVHAHKFSILYGTFIKITSIKSYNYNVAVIYPKM